MDARYLRIRYVNLRKLQRLAASPPSNPKQAVRTIDLVVSPNLRPQLATYMQVVAANLS